jgi:hypothetical protein
LPHALDHEEGGQQFSNRTAVAEHTYGYVG